MKIKKIKFYLILIISIIFIVVGIIKKDYKKIKNKASFICFECIGIG